jgi:hypothetical protein
LAVARTRKNSDEVLLTALACGATVDSAAHAAGVSARTVHRRLKEPAFQERLQEIRTEMLQRTAGMLTAAGLESVKTLITLQQAANPGSVRLGAARSVLEMGVKVREASELAQRLAALEAQTNAGLAKEMAPS